VPFLNRYRRVTAARRHRRGTGEVQLPNAKDGHTLQWCRAVLCKAAAGGSKLTHPEPLHFLSELARSGSVQQLQKKPKQQHSFMKRRMRSE
jgi:hypothetical protein